MDRTRFARVGWALLAITWLHLLVGTWGSLPVADGWSYFELSETLWTDFYRFTTWRAYSSTEPYSTAFPPLWPGMIGVFNTLWHLGPTTGWALNLGIFALLAGVLERIARRAQVPGMGVWTALGLLCCRQFVDEIEIGGSPPLAMLGLAVAIALIARRPQPSASLGAVLGAVVMTRFDQLGTAALLLAALAAWQRRRQGWLPCLGAMALMLLPWMLYSHQHWGLWLATDNRVVALSLDPAAFVDDFYVGRAPMLADDPAAWLAKVLGHLPLLLKRMGVTFAVSVSLPLAAAALGLARLRFGAWRWPSAWQAVTCAGVALAGGTAAYLTTGYLDEHYYTPLYLALLLLAALGLGSAPRMLPAWVLLALFAITANAKILRHWQHGPWTLPSTADVAKEFEPQLQCLRTAGATPDDMVLFLAENNLRAGRFGASTHWRTGVRPNNWDKLTRDDVQAFIQRFNVRYVHVASDGHDYQLANRATVQPLPGCDLWRVR